MPDIAAELADRGFCIVENILDAATLAEYRAVLDELAFRAGQRDALTSIPKTRRIVERANLAQLLVPVVGVSPRIVRAILFDKSQGANWRVPWHQDLFVAMSTRTDVPGFTAWTLKDGVNHARAPREVLERMLAVPIHIDDNGKENGPLRVLPGTHRHGVLDGAAIDRLANDVAPVACVAGAGSARHAATAAPRVFASDVTGAPPHPPPRDRRLRPAAAVAVVQRRVTAQRTH